MIHTELNKIVKNVIEYKKLPTIYEIQKMDVSNRDGKMLAAIHIMKIIKGLSYEGIYKDMSNENPFNERAYKQALGSCITFYNRKEIVVGFLVKALTILINDINLELPAKPNYDILKRMIDKFEKNFDEFFDGHLTDADKRKIKEKKENNDLTGMADIDWQAKSFNIIGIKENIEIKTRQELLKLGNEDIISHLETNVKESCFTDNLRLIYQNINKIDSKSRRWVYLFLLTAVLFRQDYNKYPVLVKQFDFLNKLLEKAA